MRSTVLIAHQGAELYGSDRQLLESVSALLDAGVRVNVALPTHGALVEELQRRGAEIHVGRFPVLRRTNLTPGGILHLLLDTVRCLRRAIRLVRQVDADAVYVNTLVLPFWILVARLSGVPVLCHVHEAYERGPRVIRALLASPLLLTQRVLVNSKASLEALRQSLPAAVRRAVVVYNGVPGPAEPPTPPDRGKPGRVVLVGRLSPNKGSDIALEAVGQLVSQGRELQLELVGNVFPGYEWFEDELRQRAAEPDLAGRVRFSGFRPNPWEALAACDVALVPSRFEPFGNTAVEAQLAQRPVVVARSQGLVEIVQDGESGLTVPPGDATALADAIARLLDDPVLAARIAQDGRDRAIARFSVDAYRHAIADEVAALMNP